MHPQILRSPLSALSWCPPSPNLHTISVEITVSEGSVVCTLNL